MSNVLNMVSEETFIDQTDDIVDAINAIGAGLMEYATYVSFNNANLPTVIDVKARGISSSMLEGTTGVKIATISVLEETTLTLSGFANSSSVEQIVFKKLPSEISVERLNDSNVLRSVIFPPNVIKATPMTIEGDLVDESLVSIGNALKIASTSRARIHLSSASKARLNTLIGTVEDGIFTQDDEGAVTLYDFITQTKGWTVV